MTPSSSQRRMSEAEPLYHNAKYDFFALSRFADVEACLKNWQQLRSGRDTLLEMIESGQPAPR